MSEPKPFASLGPTLLARKGGARPAMRPQLGMFGGLSALPAVALEQDDLGWNDMGEDLAQADAPAPAPRPDADIYRLVPEASPAVAAAQPATDLPVPEPAVKQQLRAIAEHMDRKERESRGEDVRPARRPARDQGRRAAFTLRLDADRHLKLRLACTKDNRSAQQMLTEALDRMLATIPGIDDLAAQVKRG